MKNCIWLFFFLVIPFLPCQAQDTLKVKKEKANYALDHPFIVDRPGIADMPYTVPLKKFQFEMGTDFLSRANWQGLQVPSFLFRTGISENAEIRVGIRNLLVDTTATDSQHPFGYEGGLTPITLGLKVVIIKEKGWLPQIALMTDVSLPFTSTPIYKPKYSGHDIFLLFLNNFTKKVFVNYNVGVIWEDSQPIWSYSVCLEYQANKKLGFFIEQYSYLPEEEDFSNEVTNEIAFDMGITYFIYPKVQLDCSAGYSTTQTNNNYFVGMGVSFRIDPK